MASFTKGDFVDMAADRWLYRELHKKASFKAGL